MNADKHRLNIKDPTSFEIRLKLTCQNTDETSNLSLLKQRSKVVLGETIASPEN